MLNFRITVLSDDAIGPGFAMVGFGVDPSAGLPDALQQSWRAAGGTFVQVDPRGRSAYPSQASRWEDLTGALMPAVVPVGWIAIVRPDRTVMHDGPAVAAATMLRESRWTCSWRPCMARKPKRPPRIELPEPSSPPSEQFSWPLRVLRWYYAPEFLHLERASGARPTLFVGNHSVLNVFDAMLFADALYRAHGIVLRPLADRAHFKVPVWRDVIVQQGGVIVHLLIHFMINIKSISVKDV